MILLKIGLVWCFFCAASLTRRGKSSFGSQCFQHSFECMEDTWEAALSDALGQESAEPSDPSLRQNLLLQRKPRVGRPASSRNKRGVGGGGQAAAAWMVDAEHPQAPEQPHRGLPEGLVRYQQQRAVLARTPSTPWGCPKLLSEVGTSLQRAMGTALAEIHKHMQPAKFVDSEQARVLQHVLDADALTCSSSSMAQLFPGTNKTMIQKKLVQCGAGSHALATSLWSSMLTTLHETLTSQGGRPLMFFLKLRYDESPATGLANTQSGWCIMFIPKCVCFQWVRLAV